MRAIRLDVYKDYRIYLLIYFLYLAMIDHRKINLIFTEIAIIQPGRHGCVRNFSNIFLKVLKYLKKKVSSRLKLQKKIIFSDLLISYLK